ncbi:hypothetical protein KUBF_32470 [Bacteroides finegoldii]|nr:hypothetical protein KUBF_32470 [Bacteroides finegoldii]
MNTQTSVSWFKYSDSYLKIQKIIFEYKQYHTDKATFTNQDWEQLLSELSLLFDFTELLKARCALLSDSEIRLCSLILLGLSATDVCIVMHYTRD